MQTESHKKTTSPPVLPASPAEDLSFWSYFRRRNPYVFAHHPRGEAFRDHVWEYGGIYFCKGCVMTFLGMFLGAILYLATGWFRGLNLIQTGVAFWSLLFPAVITSVFQVPPFLKHLSRILLGVVVISAAILVFTTTTSWLTRFLIVFTYFLVMIPLSGRRRRLNDALLKSKGSEI
jgi:hypothetical protein